MIENWSIRHKIKMAMFVIFNLILLTFLFTSALFYIQHPFGGKRLPDYMFISIALFAIEIALLYLLYKRLKKRKLFLANIILLAIIVISLCFFAFNSMKLPNGAKIVLEDYVLSYGVDNFSVIYVWHGSHSWIATYEGIREMPYCVVIEPALSDDRNAFIVMGSKSGENETFYYVQEEMLVSWTGIGCGYEDKITNPGFFD
jgi:multisubunit Na+/H+ antiporter MnhB subunit